MTVDQAYTFPHDPALVKLLLARKQRSDTAVVVHDVVGHEKSYSQLLGDVIRTREALRSRLSPKLFDGRGLLLQAAPYIAVLTRSSYEFLVAFFAIRALGGACIPFGSGILPEEAHHFLSLTKAACMLAGTGDCIKRSERILAFLQGHGSAAVTLPLACDSEPTQSLRVEIDESLQLAPDSPGLVLFTSGTTGLPKGAILPRITLTDVRLAEPGECSINYRPGHWVGGARTLISAMLSGREIYALGESGSAVNVLEAFKRHPITHVVFNPTLLRTMKELLIDQTGSVPLEKLSETAGWFKSLKFMGSATGVVEASTIKFWTNLTGVGMHIGYSATELGDPTITTKSPTNISGLIGTPVPTAQVKLSQGDYGEILIKSRFMLTGYVGEAELTRSAFDEEGYYKTGDLAELRDGEYHFVGRANSDFAFFRFFRIPLLRVEQSLLNLPYIAEACVVALPDHEAKELCAAVVRLDETSCVPTRDINLARIRSDLLKTTPMYMLPAVLRILKKGEQLARTFTGKANKKLVKEEFFATTEWWPHESPPAEVEYWGNMPRILEAETRPWDWCGVQRAD